MLLLLVAVPFGVGTLQLAATGDAFAIAFGVGFLAPIFLFVTVLRMAARPLHRKADPAKIRQMEHELGIEARHDPLTCAFCRVAEKAAAHSRRDDDAPTTVAAFHGAPTFGHKIEHP